MFSLKDKEVNVGRQRELDLVKGFLMIMIVLYIPFRVLQVQRQQNPMYIKSCLRCLCLQVPVCICLPWGLEVFLPCHSEPKDMVRNGVRLLVYQGLCNLCYAAAIIICFHIRILFTGEVAGSRELYEANLYSVLTFVNIFFISGMCYLVLAIYRKLEVKLSGYIISAVIVGILSPFTKLLISDNQALNWILDMTFGGKGETSFCFFPYLSYVFLGYVFGKVIRRVPENEKGEFYKKSGTVCGVIAVIWFVGCIISHPSVEKFFDYMLVQYRTPGLLKVAGSFCAIIFVFAVAFGIMPLVEKWKFGYNKLCYFSKQISKM